MPLNEPPNILPEVPTPGTPPAIPAGAAAPTTPPDVDPIPSPSTVSGVNVSGMTAAANGDLLVGSFLWNGFPAYYSSGEINFSPGPKSYIQVAVAGDQKRWTLTFVDGGLVQEVWGSPLVDEVDLPPTPDLVSQWTQTIGATGTAPVVTSLSPLSSPPAVAASGAGTPATPPSILPEAATPGTPPDVAGTAAVSPVTPPSIP